VIGARPGVTLGEIFWTFCRVGVRGFGGAMPWARRTLVEERRWLTPAEFTDTLGVPLGPSRPRGRGWGGCRERPFRQLGLYPVYPLYQAMTPERFLKLGIEAARLDVCASTAWSAEISNTR
jgi:hypothetical protein